MTKTISDYSKEKKQTKNRKHGLLKTILIVFILSHILFSLTYFIKESNTLRFYDEFDYFKISSNLAEHGMFAKYTNSPTAMRPPGYPLFLSLIFRFSKSILLIKIIQLILYYFSAFFIFKLAFKISQNKTISFIAGFLFLIYPPILFTTNTVYPQLLYLFLFLGLILIIFNKNLNWINLLIISIINGFLILINPIHLLFFPFMIYLILLKKERLFLRIKKAVFFALISFLVFFPWMNRNYKLYHNFALTSTGGINLLLGNNPNTTPNAGINVDISPFIDSEKIQNFNEMEKDNYYKKIALEFIKEKPGYYLGLYFKKFLNYFNYRNQLATVSESSVFRVTINAVSWFFILFFVIISVFNKDINIRENLLLFLIFLQSCLFYSIFFTRIRFRIPFIPFLVIIVAQNLNYYFCKLFKKYRRKECP
ncbi:MAG: hypothetical protein HQ534_12375 [Armatimonadetes bacterium]|nr:hypothetical protein [Armatimonadota bacterium]